MTETGLLLPRRRALGGAAALVVAPLAAPRIARAVAPIRIGLLLAKTGADRSSNRISRQRHVPGDGGARQHHQRTARRTDLAG